ncbi:uveal autoantigen with coiled-coil domains and ankyrin repeats isoform X1 [Lampetra fluviatilis]
MKRFLLCNSSRTEWNKYDDRLLHAVDSRDAERVSSTLQKKGVSSTKLDAEGQSAFHLAAAKGYDELLDIFLSNGADAGATDGSGRTALHLAAKNGQSQCMRHLLQYKSPVSILDQAGRTALHYAAIHGDVASVQLLCDYKAPVNSQDADGCTPLALAARMCHPEVCSHLIECGAEVNGRDNHNKTPLMVACEHASCDAAEVLLRKGADTRATDSRGHDALHHAKLSGHPDMLALLQGAAGFPAVPAAAHDHPGEKYNVKAVQATGKDRNDPGKKRKAPAPPPSLSSAQSIGSSLSSPGSENVSFSSPMSGNTSGAFYTPLAAERQSLQALHDDNSLLQAELAQLRKEHRTLLDKTHGLETQLTNRSLEIRERQAADKQRKAELNNEVAQLKSKLGEKEEAMWVIVEEIKKLKKAVDTSAVDASGVKRDWEDEEDIMISDSGREMAGLEEKARNLISALHAEVTMLSLRNRDLNVRLQRTEADLVHLSKDCVPLQQHLSLASELEHSRLELSDLRGQIADPAGPASPGAGAVPLAAYEGLKRDSERQIRQLQEDLEKVLQRTRDSDNKMRRLQQQLLSLPLGGGAAGPGPGSIGALFAADAEKDAQLQHAQKRTGELERQLKEVASKYEASAASVSRLQSEVKAMNRAVNQELVEELKRTYGAKVAELEKRLALAQALRQEADKKVDDMKRSLEQRVREMENQIASSRSSQKGAEGLVDKIKVSYEQQIRDLESQLLAARASCRTTEERATELQNLLEDSQRALPESVPLRQYEELETSFNLSLEETSERLAGLTEQYNAAQDEIGGLRHELAGLRSCSVNRQEHEAAKAATRATLDDLDRQLAEISSRHSVAEKARKALSATVEQQRMELSTMTDKFTESEKVKTVLKVELDAKRKEAADLSNKLSEAKNSKSSLASELEAKNKAVASMVAKHSDMETALVAHRSQIENLQKKLAEVTEKRSVSETKLTEISLKAQNLESNKSEMVPKSVYEQEMALLQEETMMLSRQISEMSRRVVELEDEKKEVDARWSQKLYALPELEAKYSESQAEVSRVNGMLRSAQAELTGSVPLQKHEELTASLQREIHDINQQLGETEHKYMEADKVRAALQKHVKEMSNTVEELRSKNNQFQNELSRLRTEHTSLQTTIGDLRSKQEQFEEYNKEMDELKAILAQKESERLAWKNKNEVTQNELARLQQESTGAVAATKDLERRLENALRNLAETERARTSLQGSLEGADAQLAEAKRNLSSAQSHVEQLKQELANRDAILQQSTSPQRHLELQALSKLSVAQLQGRVAEMMQAQEHSDKALAEALGEKNRALNEHGQLERAGKELQNQLAKLTEEVKVSESRLKEMQRQVAELQNENSALEVSVGEVNEKLRERERSMEIMEDSLQHSIQATHVHQEAEAKLQSELMQQMAPMAEQEKMVLSLQEVIKGLGNDAVKLNAQCKAAEEKSKILEATVANQKKEMDMLIEKCGSEYVPVEKYVELESAFNERVSEMMGKHGEVMETAQRLQKEVAGWVQKHAALTEQHVGTKEQLEKVTRKLERGSTNVEKGIVEKDNEIQRLRGEVEKLKATMEKETVSVEAFKELRFQKEAEVMALCEQLEALNKKHKEIQSLEKMEQRMASDERHLELEAEVLSLTQQLEELRNKYEESQLEFSRYRSEADGAQDEREVADSKAGDLQKHLSNLKQKLDEASRVIKELQQRLDKSAALMKQKDLKLTELQEEVGTLRQALNSLSQLPYATSGGGGGGGVGGNKRASQQLDVLQSQVKRLQQQLTEADKQHKDVVSVYRTHLLCAVQGQMDEDIQSTLLHILKMHKAKEPLR